MQVQLNVNNAQQSLFFDFMNTFINNGIVEDYSIVDEKENKPKFLDETEYLMKDPVLMKTINDYKKGKSKVISKTLDELGIK